MNKLIVAKVVCWEDSGVTLMARIEGQDAANITQASLSSIALSVFATDNDTGTADATATPVIADTVFNSLQTADQRWIKAGGSSTGYNFKYVTLASQLPAAKTYRFEFKFTPTSGEAFHVVFEVDAGDLKRS